MAIVLLAVFGSAGTAEAADTSPPVLVSHEVRPSPLDVRFRPHTVTVSIRVRDDASGSKPPHVVFASPSGRTLGGPLTQASGNSLDGTYGGSFEFARGSASGDWTVRLLPMEDNAGNRTGGHDLGTLTLVKEVDGANPADVDPSFGNLGQIAENPDAGGLTEVYDTAIDGRDRLLQVAPWHPSWSMAVGRYLPDGRPDRAFGGDGHVTVQLGAGPNPYTMGSFIESTPSGKIVVGGSVSIRCPEGANPPSPDECSAPMVARLNVDGTLDRTFGEGGAYVGPYSPNYALRHLRVLPDGRIAAVVHLFKRDSSSGPWQPSSAVTVLTAAGDLDVQFGAEGTRTYEDELLGPVAGGPGGDLTLMSRRSNPDGRVRLMRLARDGEPHDDWGADGRREVAGLYDDRGVASLERLSDGRLLVAGDLFRLRAGGESQRATLARLTPTASLDPSFGTGGVALRPVEAMEVRDLAFAADGQLVVLGYDSVSRSGVVSRWHEDGEPDRDFGSEGVAFHSFASNASGNAHRVEVQSTGRILLAGTVAYYDTGGTTGLTRLRGGRPPETTLADQPGGLTRERDVSFSFGSSASPERFECRIDGGSWQTCTSPHASTGLPDGAHAFEARAVGATGVPDATPARADFRVDATAPNVTVEYPSGAISDPRPRLSGTASLESPRVSLRVWRGTTTSDEPYASFEVERAAAEWSVPAVDLADGAWTVIASQTDAAGNTGASAPKVFVVDTQVPVASLDAAPPAEISDTTATFAFSSEAGVSFECRMEEDAWSACSSPVSYSGLAPGAHVFAVRAVDAAGNRDAAGIRREFTVRPREDVRRPPGASGSPAAPPVAPPPIDATGPTVRMPRSGTPLRTTSAGVARVRIGPTEEYTTGTLHLKTERKVTVSGKRLIVALGSKRFVAPEGRTATVAIKLSKRNRKLLRRLKKVRIRATVVLRDAAGNETTEKASFVLHAPKDK